MTGGRRNPCCFVASSPCGSPHFPLKSGFAVRTAAPLRKKSRSAHLFGCKRPHDGSLSLPPFCDSAPHGAIGIIFERFSHVGAKYALLLLFRKKLRLFCLCPCKRGHNGAAALSTFFGYAPSAYRYHFWKVNPRHHPVPSSTKKYDHVPCIAVGRRYNLIGCFTDDAPIHDGIPCHIV